MCALSIAGNSVSSAEALRESKGPTERTQGEVVGASISHPAKWFVERERYTYGQTYGFTLWRPDSGAPPPHRGGAAGGGRAGPPVAPRANKGGGGGGGCVLPP